MHNFILSLQSWSVHTTYQSASQHEITPVQKKYVEKREARQYTEVGSACKASVQMVWGPCRQNRGGVTATAPRVLWWCSMVQGLYHHGFCVRFTEPFIAGCGSVCTLQVWLQSQFLAFPSPCALCWARLARLPAGAPSKASTASMPLGGQSWGTAATWSPNPRAPLQRRPEPFKEERSRNQLSARLPPQTPLSPSSITTTTTHAPYSPCWKVTFAINLILGHFVNQCHLHLITSVIKGIMQI